MNGFKCEVKYWTLMSEFQLIATEKISKGEVIISERPLVSIAVKDFELPSAAWNLVNSLLKSPELLSVFYSLKLKVSEFPIDAIDRSLIKELAKTHMIDRVVLKDLYLCVGTNNVAYVNSNFDILGFGLYPVLSRANHSCSPNALFSPGNLEFKEAALVARRDIEPDESITWNYVRGELFLYGDYMARKLKLREDFQFVCRCDRCLAEMNANSVDADRKLTHWGCGK